MSDPFQARAGEWDASERRNRLAAAIGDAISARVALHRRLRVLDFGAGTGLLSGRIAPRVERVVAVDTSPAMLEQLRAKPELRGKVEIRCRDIVAEPLDDRFGLIVSAMALHHVADTPALLREFRRLLEDGGGIALADLDREDGSFHPPNTEGVFHQGFDRGELRALLENQGFADIEFTDAYRLQKNGGDYPVFLVTATRIG